MKDKITRITLSEALQRKGKTDWARVDALTDEEIEAAAAADPDAAPIVDAEWFDTATLFVPEPKTAISLRVDRDVLTWFRDAGRGWQTRMNAVLRTYAAAHGAKLDTPPARAPAPSAPKPAVRRATRAGSIRLAKPKK